MLVARGSRRAQRGAVKTVGESNDVVPTGDFARQFHGGFYCVRAGRTGELHAIVHLAWFENVLLEAFQEIGFRTGMHIKTVRDTVGADVIQQCLFAMWVVVAVVQRSGSGQKIDIALSVGVIECGAFSAVEYNGEGTGIGANVRFEFFKNSHERFLLAFLGRGGPATARLPGGGVMVGKGSAVTGVARKTGKGRTAPQDRRELGGGFRCDFERADAHQVFIVVPATEVALTFKKNTAGGGGAMTARPRAEQPPRCVIARRDGGIQKAHMAAHRALEDMVEHTGGKAFAAGLFSHSDLPHKQRI